jgi:hypothetical protein
MLGLAVITALMGFLFWGLTYTGPMTPHPRYVPCVGSAGFVPALFLTFCSSILLQRHWFLRPVANCGLGG